MEGQGKRGKITVIKAAIYLSLAAVIFISSVVLVRWLAGINMPVSFLSENSTMRKITAVLLILTSVTFLGVERNFYGIRFLLRITGTVVTIISVLSVITFIPGFENREYEGSLFYHFLRDDNRMAFHTSVIFTMLGMICFLFSLNRRRADNIAHLLFFVAAGISYFVLVGYLLGVKEIFTMSGVLVAPNSAICLLLLSIVALLLKPDTWLMGVLSGPGPGSLMARRLLPWILGLPLLISWLRVEADHQKYFSNEIGAILAAITYTLSYIFLIWMNARNVNKLDEKRLRAFDALQLSEARQRALIQSTSDAVYMMSPDWTKVYNLEGGNFVESVHEGLEDWISKFVPLHQQPEVIEKIKEAIENKRMFELEHQTYLIDGSIGWTLSRAVPILDENGEIKEWVGSAENTTQLRKAEEQLRRQEREEAMRKGGEEAMIKLTNELMRSNKELEQFAFLTSHDLQEPLRKINTFTGILSARIKEYSDKESEHIMQKIIQSTHRMSALVNDLLSYSLIGSSTAPFTEVNFNTLFHRVTEILAPSIEHKKATVTKDELGVVYGDEKQLQTLLLNLVENALKFTKVAPVIHVSSRTQNGDYLFSVSDNGTGIETQYSERVFLIFKRLVHRDEYEGTGIGLAICKRIVERHGGRIWFESEPGHGSTFYFTIVTSPRPSAVTSPRPSPQGEGD